MRRAFAFVFLIVFFIVSCDSKKVFEENYDFPESSWNLDTIPSFDFEIDQNTTKNIVLMLRNTASYTYQNLYLTYYLSDSSGNELETGLIEMQLFDKKTGKPLGDGSSVYANHNKILEDYQFPYTGKFKMAIAQYMREIDLREIASVGIRIEEAN